MRLRVPYFRQSNDYYCGPAAVRMMLGYHKIPSESEERIARIMKTNAAVGTRHGPMIDYLRSKSLVVRVWNKGSFSRIESALTQKLPVIVHFIEPKDEEEHYAVVTGLTDTKIVLHDPWNGKDFSMSQVEFKRRWKDYKNKYERWMLVSYRLKTLQ